MKAKQRHRAKLLRYLGDPEKTFPPRMAYSKILCISTVSVYNHFSPDELTEIENEALELRKKRTARQRGNILNALYERAIGYTHPEVKINVYEGEVITTRVLKHYPPDKQAAQEFFDRTEGKVPDRVDVFQGGDSNLTHDERAKLARKRMLEELGDGEPDGEIDPRDEESEES